MITIIKAEELTDQSFAPYGTILNADRVTPKIKEEIFTFWDGLAELDIKGKTTVALLEVYPREPKFSKLERHARTEEVFFALDRDVIALVGGPTPSADLPDLRTVKAFRLEAGKGVFLREGVWHWIPHPLGGKARLIVIFRKGTPEEDLDIKDVKEKQGIEFHIDV